MRRKLYAMRIGSRYNVTCASLTLCNGTQLQWVYTCKYLGVYLLGGRNFRCSFEEAKKKFYSPFNAVYGKIGCCVPTIQNAATVNNILV